jgi:hypothetical protein
VNDVGAGGDDVADLFTQTGEIGGQNAGSDAECGHGFGLAVKKMRYFTLPDAPASVFSRVLLACAPDLRCNEGPTIYNRQVCQCDYVFIKS